MTHKCKKGILCGLLFLSLLGLTFYLVFHGQDPGQLRAALLQADPTMLGIGAGCMAFFFCCEAKNLQRGLAMFGSPASYRACLRYAITGFFFSSVTPSASGGQPMQVYAMYRDGHPPAPGAMALLVEFFSFQLVAVALGVGGFLFHRQQLLAMPRGILVCFLVGCALNLLVALVLTGAVVSPRLLPAVGRGLLVPANRLFPRQAPGWAASVKTQWQELRHCVQCFRTHPKQWAAMLGTTLLQLLAYHSIPFWVSLALGVDSSSLPAMIAMQSVLLLSVSSLPLPGAVGLTEGGFLLLYQTIFPAALLPGAMLLSRTLSFYLFLLLSGTILAVYFLRLAWRTPAPTTTP